MKVVIIGAGVAGLGVGWRLAQAGAEVIILERAQPGSGASWAAAGMIAVTAELLDAHAAEIEFAQQSNALWPQFAEEVEAVSHRVVGFARKGAMVLAADAAELARLSRKASAPGLSLLDPAQVRALAPLVTGPQAGALWSPKEAVVDNRALGVALAYAFQRAGGRLITNEAVVRIERKNGRAAIAHTPFGLYHADVFVLAAGAWSGLIESELAPVIPVKGEMIALEPPPNVKGPLPDQVIWGHGVYVVPRGRRLLVGATAEMVGFDTALTEEAARGLRAGAEKLIPAVKDWATVDQWAGLRPRAPDGLPLLGPTSLDGLWLAGGQFRNGILFAPAIAQSITAQLMGKAAPIPAFDPQAIESMSFELHPRLAADTALVCDWPLCRVLLMEDGRYFWLVLVPRREGVTEITELSPQDRAQLMEETAQAGRIIQQAGAVKLNLGALGNLVPQLHLHVVGRAPSDPAWPGPVWGHSQPMPYDPALKARRLALVRSH